MPRSRAYSALSWILPIQPCQLKITRLFVTKYTPCKNRRLYLKRENTSHSGDLGTRLGTRAPPFFSHRRQRERWQLKHKTNIFTTRGRMVPDGVNGKGQLQSRPQNKDALLCSQHWSGQEEGGIMGINLKRGEEKKNKGNASNIYIFWTYFCKNNRKWHHSTFFKKNRFYIL